MRYTIEIEINKPIEEVVQKFQDTDNYFKWMEGLRAYELIEGEAGREGSKSRMFFELDKRRIEMVETIKRNALPNEFVVQYEANGVWNEVANHFELLPHNRTRYYTENEFKFTSPMMKVIGSLMPAAFKKQSHKYLNNFKKFVEGK